MFFICCILVVAFIPSSIYLFIHSKKMSFFNKWTTFEWRVKFIITDCSNELHSAEISSMIGAQFAFCEVGSRKIFHTISVFSCGWMWLTTFMGQPLFALGKWLSSGFLCY